MKKLAFISAVLLTSFIGVFSVQAQTTEQIRSFDVSVHIQPDASIKVREKIVYDFGDQQKHGIFRDIPESLKNLAVFDEKNQPYTFSYSGKQIKIGDADTLISGVHTYIIAYTVNRVVDYYKDFDEIYWNVTGNDWLVPINSASVRVELPQPVAQNELRVSCYVGVKGSTEKCGTNPPSSSDKIYSVDANTSSPLGVGEGITIAVGFPKGLVTQPNKFWQFVADYWGVSIPFIVFIGMFILWWKKGRHPRGRGTIVAEYDAPENLSPIEISAVLSERIANKDISAEIIYLATKGFLTITKTEEKGLIFKHDEYTLTKTSDKIPENEFDQKILSALFESGSEVKLSDLKKVFYKNIPEIKKAVFASTVTKGYYTQSPGIAIIKYNFLLFIIVGLMALIVILGFDLSDLTMIMAMISIVIIIIFSLIMPKATPEGALLRGKIKGLKLYMDVAEKDRINFHNAPEKNPALFEHLLSYAMVLGVEEKWAKQFESIYMTPPSWYHDSNMSGFNSMMFIHNMTAFNTVAASTLATSPGGGSSGGGFSGGGGGGGGGGSW